jgi:CheY-like chemotaxis protein
MSLIAEPKEMAARLSPAALVVEDDSAILELMEQALERELGCRVWPAGSVRQAKRILATEAIDLLVTDVKLPDGDGLSLLKSLRARQPFAQAIVVTGDPSVENVIQAMRQGASDLLPKPFSLPTFLDRARRAIYQHQRTVKNEARIELLRGAVRRLNRARRVVVQKVDLLCNDLVGAYGELAGQLDQVRTQESFRNLLAAARDLEQLLCHAMDWMLRQMGYCNIAIWLAGRDQFQLGAYMKHTIAGDAALVEAMRRGLLRRVMREGFMQLDAESAGRVLSSAEMRLMPGQAILATHCTYLGESLAAVILFREGSRPFTDADAATFKAIAPIFAVALAAAVHVDSKDAPEDGPESQRGWESEFGGDEPHGGLDEPGRHKRRKRSRDDDWWKRGEPPPF